MEKIIQANMHGQNYGQADTKEEFLALILKDRKNFKIGDYHYGELNNNLIDGMSLKYPKKENVLKIKPIAKKERKKRRALSDLANMTLYENAANRIYGRFPQDTASLRYPQELMMDPKNTPEAEQYNKRLYACMADPKKHTSEVIKYHYDLLKKFENMDPEKLIRPMDDSKLVTAYGTDILFASKLCLQIQNIRRYFKEKAIEPDNAEDQKLMDEMNRIMDKYVDMGTALGEQESRLETIANPLYEIIDEKDPAVMQIIGYEFIRLDYDVLFPNEEKDYLDLKTSSEMFTNMRNLVVLRQDRQTIDAVRTMNERGVANENLQYKTVIDGKISEVKTFKNKDELFTQMQLHNEGCVILFEKDHPENQVALFANSNSKTAQLYASGNELAQIYAGGGNAQMPAPKRPGPIDRLIHWFNSDYHKEQFDTYERQKALYEINGELLKKNVRAEAAQPAREDTHEKAKENREKVKDLQNQKIKEINEQIVAHGGEPESENTVKEEKSQPLADGLNVNTGSKTNEKLP